ncbi:glycoside hydrolase family 16 protein [Streptacidiphilus cavernicola]|uniref:Family 16 glycosylhydrolase n=1 Tax=Streptacidiphilus cavernicola TaxID=3342716 RepID=A0ABV6W2X9_9ACTN
MNRGLADPVLALSGWAALVATLLPAAEPVRVLLVVVFLVLCPGAAAVRAGTPVSRPGARPGSDGRERESARLEAAVLTVALSLAIGALVAEAFFLSRSFTAARALATLAAVTTLLVLTRRLRRRRARTTDDGGPVVPPNPAPDGAPPDPARPDRAPSDPARPRPGPLRRTRRVTPALALAVALALTAAGCGGGAAVPQLSPSSPSAAPSSPSGGSAGPPPAPAAPGPWHQVFDDEFSGTSLDTSHWATCYDWNVNGCTNAGNHETEWYLPSQVTVGGGLLNLTAQRLSTTGSDGVHYPWRSGMVSTGRDSWYANPRHTFTYGYFAARIKVPAGAGFFPAFWLMPASRTTPPELDVIEFIGGTRTAVMTVHWVGPGGKDLHEGKHYVGAADYSAGYHVFALDWEKNSLTWYIDGVARLSLTEHVPHVPMEVLLTLAVGFPSAPPASADSAVMRTDWVRIWQH